MTDRVSSDKVGNAVYRISQAADSVSNLNEFYKAIHEIIKSVIKAENLYIALFDEKNDMIEFTYYFDEKNSILPGRKTRKGFTEYVLQTGESLIIDVKNPCQVSC